VSTEYIIYMVIAGLGTAVGGYISNNLRRKFAKYSQVAVSSGMSGKEVAENMLAHYGVSGVNIVQGKGMLTDHYNPQTRTVSLSPDVYNGRHVSAAAVAAHEVGHAIQHDTEYPMLQMRSQLVPLVSLASKSLTFLMGAALYMANQFPMLLLITIVAFAMTTLFSLVTLPVEFDASKRALNWLDETGVANQGAEYDGAKDALKWAAMTYVAAALSSLITLLYLIWQYSNRR